MKTPFFTLCFILFFSFLAFAQEATFKVVAVKGKVSTNNKLIAQNAEIKAIQSITVADDSSYICLVSNDKKEIIEVSKKGSYQMADLKKQAVMLGNNYAKFVADELLEIETAKYDSVRLQQTKKTWHWINPHSSSTITMLPRETVMRYSDKITVKWFLKSSNFEFNKAVDHYKAMIFNLEDHVLFEEKTSEMRITIDLSKTKKLIEEKVLVLKIVPLNKLEQELESRATIDGYAIVGMEESEKQQITQELNTIFKDQNRETAFGKLVEARFFEDKELYIDAINAYEDALNLSFGAESYQKVYRFFLERNNLWQE
ncbi:MAG: hypothetical protein EAZ08_00205 [Cytophagales bacterium]|nr:MAG: hypothetical protein EAZ08_00205 [Cytophagales bacterium]